MSTRAAVGAARALLPRVRFSLCHAAEALEDGFARLAGLDEVGRAELRAASLAQARADMDRFADECAAPDLPTRVEYGYPVAMIDAVAARDAIDLLVLGKRGRSALEHWAFGSVTAHLARSVSCDVLIVPPPRHDEPPAEQPPAGGI